MRSKLFGAEFTMPLVETSGDEHEAQKEAMLADLLEDELDAMGEWDMKVKLKQYMWEDYARFDDEILDENWQILAKSWGLELRWTEKETNETV